MIGPVLLIAAAFAGQGAPAPTPQSEMLAISVPDGFDIGYHARNATMEITEIVAKPETVEAWSRLVTLQLFFGLAPRLDANAFYARWRDGMRASCAGLTDAALAGSVDGRPAVQATLACPLNPQTGKPENLVVFVVQGRANMMMVQIAVRHALTRDDTALIQRVGGSVKVCDQKNLSSCDRKGAGFVQGKP